MQTARTARTILILSFCHQAKQGTWQQESLATAAPPKAYCCASGNPGRSKGSFARFAPSG